MGLLTLFGFRRHIDTTRVAHELAGVCLPTVRSQVAKGLLPRARAEARGYIRVKSGSLIHSHVERYLLSNGVHESVRPQLRAEITQRVVHLLVDELLRVGGTRKAA
jgi:hypothetical protein